MENSFKEKRSLIMQLKIPAKFLPAIIVVEIILILILSYFVILKPKYESIKKSIDLGARQQLLNLYKMNLTNLEKLSDSMNKLERTDFKRLEDSLPLEQDLPGLFVQAEYLAGEVDLSLDSISISDQEVTDDYLKALASQQSGPFSFELKKKSMSMRLSGGDYDKLKSFLKVIESNIRILDIVSISFSNPDKYIINMETYYLTSSINAVSPEQNNSPEQTVTPEPGY